MAPELLRTTSWPAQVRVHEHARNLGKGAALRTALGHARGTYATVMDADLEYDPANIARLLEPLQAGDARAVFGTGLRLALGVLLLVRRRQQDRDPDHQPALQLVAVGHHDLPQARGTDLFRSLPLRERGFAIEPEITARLLLAGVRIYEVPSPTGRARARRARS